MFGLSEEEKKEIYEGVGYKEAENPQRMPKEVRTFTCRIVLVNLIIMPSKIIYGLVLNIHTLFILKVGTVT